MSVVPYITFIHMYPAIVCLTVRRFFSGSRWPSHGGKACYALIDAPSTARSLTTLGG